MNTALSSCKIPVEIWDYIFQDLSNPELLNILRVCKAFCTIAERSLYRSINNRHHNPLEPAKTVACLRSLCKNDHTPSFVRELDIDWSDCQPTSNLYRILNRTLRRIHKLTSLIIDLPLDHSRSNLGWIFDGCKFRLQYFATSIYCGNGAITSFLNSQPCITELSLRGFHCNALSSLQDNSLPRLTYLRAVHADSHILSKLICGRPVLSVSLSLFEAEKFQSLDILRLSARSIKRLTIMCVERNAIPGFFLPEIADRLPHLEALHVVVLMAQYTTEMLRNSAHVLEQFKSLKYLTLMAPGGPTSVSEEQSIATSWHRACPSLKTIILPQGKVWFEKEGKWSCLDD